MIGQENIEKYCALYELYPNTVEGRFIAKWIKNTMQKEVDVSLVVRIIRAVIEGFYLSEKELAYAQEIFGQNLMMDPAKEWLKVEFFYDFQKDYKIDYYSTILDVMAFLINQTCAVNATEEDKIKAIGKWIYESQLFIFPKNPYKNIDQYSYLSKVIDQRTAVCLGFTGLYLSLAQRMGISLTAVTVPQHIYPMLTLKNGTNINIETTAKGLFTRNDSYMNFSNKIFHQRSFKETAGLVLMNAGSIELEKNQFHQALVLYQRALELVVDEPILNDLIVILRIILGDVSIKDKYSEDLFCLDSGHFCRGSRPLKLLWNDYQDHSIDLLGLTDLITQKEFVSSKQIKNYLESLIRRYPFSKEVCYRIALFYLEQDNPQQAKEYYTPLVGDPEWEFHLAEAYLKIYDMKHASQHAFTMKNLLIEKSINKMSEKLQELLKKLSSY
ncbi:transglutaminase family protein [Candidatus Clavichlamydia salmonicola]|uniref:transglutaminase family protein n=1 Tax=Candidatus Clavichlamydia salmonicola TaxID=469812 RepID=UPI0018918BBE|nr:transglutaminase family protein [Candidatus Clavichlamydia salmonicola]